MQAAPTFSAPGTRKGSPRQKAGRKLKSFPKKYQQHALVSAFRHRKAALRGVGRPAPGQMHFACTRSRSRVNTGTFCVLSVLFSVHCPQRTVPGQKSGTARIPARFLAKPVPCSGRGVPAPAARAFGTRGMLFPASLSQTQTACQRISFWESDGGSLTGRTGPVGYRAGACCLLGKGGVSVWRAAPGQRPGQQRCRSRRPCQAESCRRQCRGLLPRGVWPGKWCGCCALPRGRG